MNKKTRKIKLLNDLKVFHTRMSKMAQQDPNSIMSSEDCAECRRLIREKRDVGLTEGEELRAIHSK